jgi:hypothetical protein
VTQSVVAVVWPAALAVVGVLSDMLLRACQAAPTKAPSDAGDSGFFGAVLVQYLAMDALHWSHVNTLTAI